MNWTTFQSRLMVAASAFIITGATGWAGWMTNQVMEIQSRVDSLVSEDKVINLIEKQSPYTKDEPLIKYQLDSIQKKLDSIDKKLELRTLGNRSP